MSNSSIPQGKILLVRYEHEMLNGYYVGRTHLLATFQDGREYPIFSYYNNEISFSPDELEGKTYAQAIDLYTKKDIEFLQR